MDFRPSASVNQRMKLSVENITFNKDSKPNECHDKDKSGDELKVVDGIDVDSRDSTTDAVDKDDDNRMSMDETDAGKKTEDSSIVVRIVFALREKDIAILRMGMGNEECARGTMRVLETSFGESLAVM